MMIYDGPSEYYKRGFNSEFKKDTPYYVALVNKNNELITVKVYIESLYEEDSMPGFYSNNKPSNRMLAKLFIPQSYYKSFMHKWFNKPSTKYEFLDEYIYVQFIKPTELEAKMAYLNVMSNANATYFPAINQLSDEFALEYPDLFLNKMQNYKGLRISHPPKYQYVLNDIKSEGIQTIYG